MLAQKVIMRAKLLCAIVVSVSMAGLAAQSTTPPAPAQSPKKDAPKSLTLTGCVAPDNASAGHFTLADFTTGAPSYRLAGKDLGRYLGRRVELIGAAARPKVSIITGLTPSPNVAAQAGAMDPAEAERARLGGSGNAQPGNIVIPEVTVKTVKVLAGRCPPGQ
jgi:hypothetical protein